MVRDDEDGDGHDAYWTPSATENNFFEIMKMKHVMF